MSQNKTVVPGMGEERSSKGRGEGAMGGFYSRTEVNGGYGRKRETVVPGMNNVGVSDGQQQRRRVDGVPIMGFLYSISRQGIGEYWPIQVGRNTIGRAGNNDIVLPELTVSDFHATLAVRKMKSNGKVIALIRDEGSKTGILVNGEELGYEGHECFDGDIITIGCNYTFLFILVNAEERGLSISSDFQEAVVEEDIVDDIPSVPGNSGERATFNPYDHNHRGTMAMDGTPFIDEPGKTKFM